MENQKLKLLRDGAPLSLSDLLVLTIQLSIPAILAQISTVAMEFIDASMLGHLGSNEAAAIGLVASSTWLMGGLCVSVCSGFNVQIAQAVGAGSEAKARSIVRQGLIVALVFSILLLLAGVGIHTALPHWLGGAPSICADASRYFLISCLFLPVMILRYLTGGMLQCSGNMRLPGILQALMCFMDVVFNYLLIFPTQQIAFSGLNVTVPGAGLGVTGAALGTGLSELVGGAYMLYYLLFRSPALHLRPEEGMHWSPATLMTTLKIGVPIAFEQVVMSGAQIVSTRIVSPLGVTAIAAHTFSISVESLCYMPGYGIGSAATTLIGQSYGARRHDVTKKLAWLTTFSGMLVMSLTGVLMYLFAPEMIGLMSPDPAIQQLGASVLRIEAFAEPFYAASIVASGALRGVGDTLIPSCLNFVSMWVVRIPLSAYLASRIGLRGVWLAMCVELCVRGLLFLIRLGRRKWSE